MTNNTYGIIANVIAADSAFRLGGRAWLAGGAHALPESAEWLSIGHKGRQIHKWAPLKRFGRFRAAFIPPHLRDRLYGPTGTKEAMAGLASSLEREAAEQRGEHVVLSIEDMFADGEPVGPQYMMMTADFYMAVERSCGWSEGVELSRDADGIIHAVTKG